MKFTFKIISYSVLLLALPSFLPLLYKILLTPPPALWIVNLYSFLGSPRFHAVMWSIEEYFALCVHTKKKVSQGWPLATRRVLHPY